MPQPADLLFQNLSKQIEEHICPICQGKAREFRNKASEQEQKVSGMCQDCQDETFGKC